MAEGKKINKNIKTDNQIEQTRKIIAEDGKRNHKLRLRTLQ
jgi:hypothetical protein